MARLPGPVFTDRAKSADVAEQKAGLFEDSHVDPRPPGELRQRPFCPYARSRTLKKLKDHIEMTVTAEGLRIELMEGEAGTFFESGNPVPTTEGK